VASVVLSGCAFAADHGVPGGFAPVFGKNQAVALAERLQAALGGGEPIETRGGEYRFRILTTHAQWSAYLASAAGEIDYPNFKPAVATRHGTERARAYDDVCAVMRDLQDRTL
jgi:hypothetical protein